MVSEVLFHQERNAIQRPLKLTFDDYVIKRFNVPSGSNNVMMNNLISGNLPTKLFCKPTKISTKVRQQKVLPAKFTTTVPNKQFHASFLRLLKKRMLFVFVGLFC